MGMRGRRGRSTRVFLLLPPSAFDLPVGNLREHWKTGSVNDCEQPFTFVKFNSIAIEHYCILFRLREPPKLRVDEAKAANHVFYLLVRPSSLLDVLLDRVGARREHDRAIGLPLVADPD